MLSTENPPAVPADPIVYSSSCPNSQRKTTCIRDEKASASSDKLVALQQESDLLKSSQGDNIDNSLPKFSIRDYVFGARSKDIAANWPFSKENLELCLKHRVTDVLPPFQPLESVRNPSISGERCPVQTESSFLDKETISKSNEEIPRSNDQLVSSVPSDSDGSNKKLALDYVDTNLGRSEVDQPHPEVDSVPTNTSCCSGALIEKTEAAVSPVFRETGSAIQPPVKKCRLIVKLSNLADPRTKEHTNTPNTFMVSETMASKVCPVCKTFSSSSNTTLNAHIDQCLSGESSSMKWTANSNSDKVIKHRIKSRKMRLMVDIYTTAKHFTLEELDRRNGTNWAAKSNFPVEEMTELRPKEREERMSSVNLEDTGHEGAVYIDAQGKKVGILSKFSDVGSASKVGDDPASKKILKGGTGIKDLSTKKRKKPHSQRHHKFLKLSPHSNKFGSSKPIRTYETRGCQERKSSLGETLEKQEGQTQCFKAQEPMKLDDSGTIRRWVCSKRSALTKKTRGKDEYQRSGYSMTRALQLESDHSSLGDSYMERSRVPKTPDSSENLISSFESSKRMDTSSCDPRFYDYGDQPPVNKRTEFPSFRPRVGSCGKKSLVSPKENPKLLRKEGTPVHIAGKDPRNYTEVHACPAKSSDSFVVSSKPSQSHFSSKARRFSSLKKDLLSVSRASVPESKFILKRTCSALEKSQVQDAVQWASQVNKKRMMNHAEKQSWREEITDRMSLGRTSGLKIRKKRRPLRFSRKEEAFTLKSSPSAPQLYGNEVRENIDSSGRVGLSSLADTVDDQKSDSKEEVQPCGKGIVSELSARIASGESILSLNKSLDSDSHQLAGTLDAQRGSQRIIEAYQGPLCGSEGSTCPTAPSLGAGREMFSADEVGNGMLGLNAYVGVELDSKDEQGNYFDEVDPISIPGPPGSFLPSPRGMSSEDLQGNSSLTSSRVQSSEDHHDMVDGDSTDSPISATSTISNPTLARSDSRSSDRLSVHDPIHDEIRQGFSGSRNDPVVENSAPAPHVANKGTERVKVSFRSDQPCCCSRKDINYNDSPLLRRRTMASVPLPVIGKQISGDPNKGLGTSNSRSEMFPLGSYQNSESGKAVLPVEKSPAGLIPLKVSVRSEVKNQIRGDCDIASPSASTPVLRLMGKNLMVVNKDEDASPERRQSQPSTMNEHPSPQLHKVFGVPSCNFKNEDFQSFCQAVPESSIIFSQNQHDAVQQHSDVRLSTNFRSQLDTKTPKTAIHSPGVMFPSKTIAGGFSSPLERHAYSSLCNFPAVQKRSMNRPDAPLTYDMEKFGTLPGLRRRNADSTSNTDKEVIIIDDTPENKADAATDAMYNECVRSRTSSFGISVPMVSEYDPRNPFYSYQLPGSPAYGGSPAVHNASFQMPPPMGMNANRVKWNCTPEGSGVLHPGSFTFTTTSSSTGHPRSTLYYSQSFS